MDLIYGTLEASTLYECANNELKKEYLINYINLYKKLVADISGYKGCFGTGYPFYALGENYEGQLPIIEEQLRYNYELNKHEDDLNAISKCNRCLSKYGHKMSNLKNACKKCKVVSNEFKPRKIINRLPDLDLWMIVETEYENEAEIELVKSLSNNNIYPSDINPMSTTHDVYEIAFDLIHGVMPKKFIPIDTHIVTYNYICYLIKKLNPEFDNAIINDNIPYIPILPRSLRKKWQYDDKPYNFVHDYLYAFTILEGDNNLLNILNSSRKELVSKYDNDELQQIAILTGSESVARRQQNPVLIKRFNERMNVWRKL